MCNEIIKLFFLLSSTIVITFGKPRPIIVANKVAVAIEFSKNMYNFSSIVFEANIKTP